jgi:TonB family protein
VDQDRIRVASNRFGRCGVRLWQAAVLALIVAMALPCRAEDRAVKSRVPPVYPEMAKRLRITGEVKIIITIDANGNVTEAKPASGNNVLAQAAMDAIKRWKYEAGDGFTTLVVTINFEH